MADEQGDSRGEARQSFYAKQLLIDSARNTFQQLAAIMRNATLYPEAHPQLLAAADKLREKIEELLVERKEVAFLLSVVSCFLRRYPFRSIRPFPCSWNNSVRGMWAGSSSHRDLPLKN
jgi:hypothetical protein